jgi:hypothetical protein
LRLIRRGTSCASIRVSPANCCDIHHNQSNFLCYFAPKIVSLKPGLAADLDLAPSAGFNHLSRSDNGGSLGTHYTYMPSKFSSKFNMLNVMMRWGYIRPGAHLAGEFTLGFYDDELAIKFEFLRDGRIWQRTIWRTT